MSCKTPETRRLRARQLSNACYKKHRNLRCPTEGDLPEKEAQALCPPGPVYFYKQVKQMRWAINVNGTQRNRGFMKHGHRQGMQELLQFAWAWRLRQDGMLLQDCPILGLFPERTGDTEKDEYVHMHFKVPT